MTDEDHRLDLTPCAHGCIMGTPRGMATNGGCQHLQEDERETRRLLRLAAAEVRRLRANESQTRAALSLLVAELAEHVPDGCAGPSGNAREGACADCRRRDYLVDLLTAPAHPR